MKVSPNQAAIDAANKKIDDYEEDFHKAAYFLVDSISDSELFSVTTVLDDPVAIWNKLQQKEVGDGKVSSSEVSPAFRTFGNRDSRRDHIEI